MHYISNLNIENNLTNTTFSPKVDKTTTTVNGTLTLTNLSCFTQIISGESTGYKVVLPNATSLTNGWKFDIYNESMYTINVYLNDTTTLFSAILPASFLALTLESSTTTNGSWLRWATYTGGTASGILHYDVSSDTPYTLSAGTADTLITGMTITPQQGEYSIWYEGSLEISGNNTVVRTTLYQNNTLINESVRTVRSSVSTFFTIHSTSAIASFTGSQPLQVRVSRSANSLTVNSRSLIMIRLGDGI